MSNKQNDNYKETLLEAILENKELDAILESYAVDIESKWGKEFKGSDDFRFEVGNIYHCLAQLLMDLDDKKIISLKKI